MKFTKIFLGLAVFLAFSTLTSCLDNDDDSAYYNNSGVIGIVTVKPLSSSSCYMQLDDSTTLFPLNDISSAFSLYRERRAIVHFNVNKSGNAQGYSYAIYVNSIDSILTKTLAPNMKADKDFTNIRGDKRYDGMLERVRLVGDKLLILKNAAPYERTGKTEPRFTYAEPTDSGLVVIREFFNLDSIAGKGDEISRMKNLLYWFHDAIRHE